MSNAGTDHEAQIARDRKMLIEARAKGKGPLLGAFLKLSGPGWLQSAITLGGGSLAGSLYMGVIGGYQFMWLQPMMMILGVVMLCAIAYVTLSTGERPFAAINKHINPVLGWAWLIAAMMANLVWAMPQFSLGTAAIQQNLFPETLGDGPGAIGGARYLCVLILFIVSSVVVWFYGSSGWGMRLFEWILKAMVAVVVISFFGVVIAMSIGGGLDWGGILRGFIPDFSLLSKPADGLQTFIDASSDRAYWTQQVLDTQRERMIAAAATAVGINMTFLLPYSMLRKGWDRNFRGLAAFDLSTGLFIPFVLATSCVVLAAAAQFHGKFDPDQIAKPAAQITGAFRGNLEARVKADESVVRPLGVIAAAKLNADEPDVYALNLKTATQDELTLSLGRKAFDALPADAKNSHLDKLNDADKQLAYMLVRRDSVELANSLEKLTGKNIAQTVFGIGVLGMAISTIIILMLINGFCVTEMTGRDGDRIVHRLGALLPGIVGGLGFLAVWTDKQANFWLAVPTSNFGMVLLPIAYATFFLMMNNRNLMGDSMLTGGKRTAMNIAMLAAILVASVGAGMSIWANLKWTGVGFIAAFLALVVIVHFARRKPA